MMTGVRDTGRTGSKERIENALRMVCAELESAGSKAGVHPSLVIGAGMIGSALGLANIPHLPAPAGLEELAAGATTLHVPHVTHLPVVLIPGVKSGSNAGDIADVDVMRGEETLSAGLLHQHRLHANSCVLNLGSHWKLIGIDGGQRIAWSETTLSGELAHAAWRETILAEALPTERPDDLDSAWVARGRATSHARGLARALFCVRLLAQQDQTTHAERLAYFYGAFIDADLRAWLHRSRLAVPRLAIVGASGLAKAWASALEEHGITSDVLPESDAEYALLAGLSAVRQSDAFAAARRS
jgi:2-dehydro-3-deoxygalactonokinase